MDSPEFPGEDIPTRYVVSRYVLFASTSCAGLQTALYDTLGPRLADGVCLLFMPEGQRGEFACREAVLALDLPDSTPGPYVAVVRSDTPEAAFERLELMAGLGHEYGFDPEYISAGDVRRLAG